VAESIVGGEKDLYGTLQVEETADETMISKQYCKIALSTHPGKIVFLVLKMHSSWWLHILSYPAKRTEHD
jgi:hypothetical protein